MTEPISGMDKLTTLSNMVKEGVSENALEKMKGMLKKAPTDDSDIKKQGGEFGALLAEAQINKDAGENYEKKSADNPLFGGIMDPEQEEQFLKIFHKNVTNDIQKNIKHATDEMKKNSQ